MTNEDDIQIISGSDIDEPGHIQTITNQDVDEQTSNWVNDNSDESVNPEDKSLLGNIAAAVGAAAVGAVVAGPVGDIAGKYVGEKLNNRINEPKQRSQKREASLEDSSNDDSGKKKKGGGCSGGSSSSSSSSDSASSDSSDGTSPNELGDVNIEDVDNSVENMCKKVYTVYRAIEKEYSCPIAQRDNVADQQTPQDDLLVMEKTVRDFLKLESKIYDAESTNPKFFASENWVQRYEKDKNIVLALLDQFRTNVLRQEHIYNIVDNNSYAKLNSIPNQDCKSYFQTNILWTSRALKDWGNNWFIKKNAYSNTPLFDKDYWLPGLTGQMVQWMKLGSYKEATQVRAISNESMIKQVDKLEAVIDRLMNKAAIQDTISKFVNLKEKLEQKANQKEDRTFTSSVIDSQMGEKLGVTNTGVTNEKKEGTTYIAPKEDEVEDINLVCKLSCVKKLFKELREKALDDGYKACRCVSCSGPGPYPDIWCRIEDLAEPVYTDLDILNELIEDKYNDFESPGKHCNVTHAKLCPKQLKKRITSLKCIIQDGVIDVICNQAMLPKKGLNILDSMFNQLWEYGEKGPTIEMPSWCQEAINSIDAFEKSMMDAWSEVFDCWEREFITRLWNIEVDHHTSNFERTQTNASIGGDTKNSDITPLKGILTCPGHIEKLMKPVCIQYRVFNISHLARNFRADVKSLCQWMTAAIQAVGIKQAAISAVMSDPTLNGDCGNKPLLEEINNLKEDNYDILAWVEKAYGIYQDVNNLKNKKEYDEEIALHELQPNKYSNEDQMNMTSSVQSESDQKNLMSNILFALMKVKKELRPWNHLSLSENKVEPKCIPVKCACNKFDKVVKSAAGFESMMNLEK